MLVSKRFWFLCTAALFALLPAVTAARDVAVPAEQIEALGIRLVEVSDTATQPLEVLPATVVPALSSRDVIPVPFAGSISKLFVLDGQAVTKGQEIAIVTSYDYHEIQAKIIESDADLKKAQLNAERQRNLANKKIIPLNDALEAEEQVQKIATVGTEFRDHAESLGVRKVDDSSFMIVAPGDGKVSDLLALNEKVEATAAVATLKTNDGLWLEAQIPASLISRAKVGDHVEIEGRQVGNIKSIGTKVDRMTRSATMLVSLIPELGLIEGQYVTITVVGKSGAGAAAVPATAVTFIDGKPSVFLRTDNGFKKLEVTLLGKSPLVATVKGDLKPGQLVAANRLPELENLSVAD